MLKIKELADKKEVAGQERAKGLNGGLFILKDYIIQENQKRAIEFNEVIKYNPRYLKETEIYAKNLEALKAYYAYAIYW